MSDVASGLVTLTRLAVGPLRSEEAAAALGTDVATVERQGERLIATGEVLVEMGGLCGWSDEKSIASIPRHEMGDCRPCPEHPFAVWAQQITTTPHRPPPNLPLAHPLHPLERKRDRLIDGHGAAPLEPGLEGILVEGGTDGSQFEVILRARVIRIEGAALDQRAAGTKEDRRPTRRAEKPKGTGEIFQAFFHLV